MSNVVSPKHIVYSTNFEENEQTAIITRKKILDSDDFSFNFQNKQEQKKSLKIFMKLKKWNAFLQETKYYYSYKTILYCGHKSNTF